MHAADADLKICMQILHMGALAPNPACVAPSAVKSRIASYKAPSLYEWVDELPRNHLGKILKNDLRKMYGEPAAKA